MIWQFLNRKWLRNPQLFLGEPSARHSVRVLTGSLRMLPDFVVIGVGKCGTTSLYDYIAQHPNVRVAMSKEINYFNWYLGVKSERWYRAHFPLRLERTVAALRGRRLLTGEATPLYSTHPPSAPALKKVMPSAKLILVLRDPVRRAYSHYHDLGVRLGGEKRSFDEAVRAEAAEIQSNYGDFPAFQHRSTRKPVPTSEPAFSRDRGYWLDARLFHYVSMGLYAEILSWWLQYFAREQLLVLTSERLQREPEPVMVEVFKFLELVPTKVSFQRELNKGTYEPMQAETKEFLREFYKPYNQRLVDLLGWNPGWNEQ